MHGHESKSDYGGAAVANCRYVGYGGDWVRGGGGAAGEGKAGGVWMYFDLIWYVEGGDAVGVDGGGGGGVLSEVGGA